MAALRVMTPVHKDTRKGVTLEALTFCLGVLAIAPNRGNAADAMEPLSMVSPDEPGQRLSLRGTVYAADGTTPVSGASVHIYHTDASGVYSAADRGVGERNPRLHCRLTTDERGRYAVRTILPGPYPGGRTPRHIHIIVTTFDGSEHNATFSFADDPNHTSEDMERHARDGTFSSIRPVERAADGSLECTRDIRTGAAP